MNRRTGRRRGACRCQGFTLVELLVVIVIISILIGLLVPAVGMARRAAKNAASKATVAALDQALETYKGDSRIGAAYPPSYSDEAGGDGLVRNPYLHLDGLSVDPISISGAGLLVWALSGADGLGCPGFKPVRQNSARWSEDTDSALGSGPGDSGAYALYESGAQQDQPVYARSGPYVDQSRVSMTGYTGWSGFTVLEEAEARDKIGAGLEVRRYPMYLDGFGYPILYWRADPAGRRMADRERPLTGSAARGIYHWEDNGGLLYDVSMTGGDPDPNTAALVLNKSGEGHSLEYDARSYQPTDQLPLGFFQAYIRNNNVTTRFEPQRSDSYLLVSPGYDGRYGTADDVTNFQHTGP